MIGVKVTDFTQLCREDLALIELMRMTAYGELTIKIRAGKPVLVEKGIQTIKLEGE